MVILWGPHKTHQVPRFFTCFLNRVRVGEWPSWTLILKADFSSKTLSSSSSTITSSPAQPLPRSGPSTHSLV